MDENALQILSDECVNLMDQNRKHLPPKLMQLHNSITESLQLTDFNIQEKALASANVAHGWVTTLFAEQALLTKMEKKKEQWEEEYINKYGQIDPNKPRFVVKDEMQKSDDLKKINVAIEEQSECVRYLNECIKIIKNQQWDIRNVTEIMKLEN